MHQKVLLNKITGHVLHTPFEACAFVVGASSAKNLKLFSWKIWRHTKKVLSNSIGFVIIAITYTVTIVNVYCPLS